MAQKDDFPTKWSFTHWYPSNNFVGDESCTHEMRGHEDGDDLVLESIPDKTKSYMFVRLHIGPDNVATGSWHEATIKESDYKGANYSGSGQLIMNPETYYMEGKWAGAGYDHKLETMRIYTGNWEIAPLKDTDT